MVTPLQHNIGALFITPESTFATDPGAGSDIYLPVCAPFSRAGLKRKAIEDESERQAMHRWPKIIGAKSESELSTDFYLAGWSASVPVSAPTTLHPHSRIISMALGGSCIGGYAAALSSGSTTSVLKVASSASFTSGQAVVVDTSSTATPNYEVGWVKKVDAVPTPHEITLLQSLSAAPAAGKALYGSYTAFVRPSNGATSSVTLRHKGQDATDSIGISGCRPKTMSLSIPPRDMAKLTTAWNVATWTAAGSGGAPAVQTWAYAPHLPVSDCRVCWGDDLATLLKLGPITVDFGLETTPQFDGAKLDAVGEWDVMSRNPTISFTKHAEAAEVTEFGAQTGKAFTIAWGTQPGRMFAVCMPLAQVEEEPSVKEWNKLQGTDIKLYAGPYTADTGTGSDSVPCDSCFRFAFL